MIKKQKSLPVLKAEAVKRFNAYIRKRDEGQPCISCGNPNFQHAGHFYSGGHFELMRFTEDNVWGQCQRCNFYLSGNLIPYRIRLQEKIGIERVEALDQLAAQSKRIRTMKRDRFFYQNIIEVYSEKIKNLS